jgi:hypothetical protein
VPDDRDGALQQVGQLHRLAGRGRAGLGAQHREVDGGLCPHGGDRLGAEAALRHQRQRGQRAVVQQGQLRAFGVAAQACGLLRAHGVVVFTRGGLGLPAGPAQHGHECGRDRELDGQREGGGETADRVGHPDADPERDDRACGGRHRPPGTAAELGDDHHDADGREHPAGRDGGQIGRCDPAHRQRQDAGEQQVGDDDRRPEAHPSPEHEIGERHRVESDQRDDRGGRVRGGVEREERGGGGEDRDRSAQDERHPGQQRDQRIRRHGGLHPTSHGEPP